VDRARHAGRACHPQKGSASAGHHREARLALAKDLPFEFRLLDDNTNVYHLADFTRDDSAANIAQNALFMRR
jgi:hypothetical protein